MMMIMMTMVDNHDDVDDATYKQQRPLVANTVVWFRTGPIKGALRSSESDAAKYNIQVFSFDLFTNSPYICCSSHTVKRMLN